MRRPLTPHQRDDHERVVEAVGATLGEDAFSAAWTEGRAMSQGDAIAYALGEGKV